VVFYIPLWPFVVIKLFWESTAAVNSLLNLSIKLYTPPNPGLTNIH
jgi:hypothetical protein